MHLGFKMTYVYLCVNTIDGRQCVFMHTNCHLFQLMCQLRESKFDDTLPSSIIYVKNYLICCKCRW